MINARRLLLGAAACALAAGAVVCAITAARPAAALARSAAGARPPYAVSARTDPVRHVVVVGISALRWSQVTPSAAPAVWHLAARGSAGALVDYAEHSVACPADGWLALNSGARAAAPGPLSGGECAPLPAVAKDGAGARIPDMPRLIAYNAQFRQNPDWGVLGRLASCATAVGPGAALALTAPDGAVPGYVPSPAGITPGLLARCPLTVIDLGQIAHTERIFPPAPERTLSRVMAGLPPDTLLLLTAPGGAAGSRPHLLTTVVSGPGYAGGLLTAGSTRRPGIVTLTDLTPSVAHWLGRAAPGYLAGSVITRGNRGSLAAAVRALTARDTAEQVWMSTRASFFAGYAALDVLLLGVPALAFWGAGERNRRRRAACWRVGGTVAAAIPAGTFLAGLAPWPQESHPSVWLYGMSAGWTAVLAGLAFAFPWRRNPLAPGGVVCLVTLGVLGADVMTGSRLQLESPFGLSLLESGRYYGIGNSAIGVYCVAALAAAAWLAIAVLNRRPGRRREAIALAGAAGVFAVAASGWPGFGAKVGGTIALVPCLALLLLVLAGGSVRWRYAVPVALSGLTLVAVFALVSYLVPAAGISDIGAFFGNLLHGQGGAVLERKAASNLGTLTASPLSPLVPAVMLLTGLVLWWSSPEASWRPSWFRLRTLPLAFGFSPLLRTTVWLAWLVLVIGWLADDSGVLVPAAAAPFAVPLVIGMCASVCDAGAATGYRGNALAGSSVAGQPVRLRLDRQARVQYQLSRLTAGPVLRALALGHPKVTGLEHVPETGPAILASNHLSVVDSFYLPLVVSRPVVFPAKAEYFAPKNLVGRVFAAYLKSTNQLPMDRGGARAAYATLDAAVEILRDGNLFGFYPEGTRSPDGRLYRGRSGIGYLALQSGAPVLPVAMLGTRKMLPPGTWLPRPARIEIRIGKPLGFAHLAGDPPAKARRMIADQVTAAIGELSGQEYVHEYASEVKSRLTAAGHGAK